MRIMRRHWRGRAAAAVISSILAIGAAAPASAQPAGPVTQAEKDAARRNYRTAEQKLIEGNYAAALPYFEQAEAIVPIPATKYKIALCHDRLGHVGEAVHWYQVFLDASPPGTMADAIVEAQARLAALRRATTGQIRVSVTPADALRL